MAALTYERLIVELPSLPAALRGLVITILSGTDSMDPSHIDMLGRVDGIRWWKVNPDGSKCLYYECFEICRINRECYNSAPDDVRGMVDALVASDHTTQCQAAQVSLTKAIIEDCADRERIRDDRIPALDARYLTSEASDAVTQLVTFVLYHNHPAPINTTQLYQQTMLHHGSTTANPQGKRKRAHEAETAGVTSTKRSTAGDETFFSAHDSSEEERRPSQAAKRAKHESSPKAARSRGASRQRAIGSLAPGKKYYHWTDARLRVWRELKGFADEELPSSALSGVLHGLESSCTSATVDPRFCDFDMSVEEILTVSKPMKCFFFGSIVDG
jgi:hypothetical protein